MTLYVFSDSHGSTNEMIAVLKEKPPNAVIYLGDGLQDAQDVASIYPEIPFYMVPGNCDYGSTLAPIQELLVGEVHILFSHGHLWQVKQRGDLVRAIARQQEAHIVLHGHTHNAICENEGDLWILNPGPAPESYGIIHVEEDSYSCELKVSPSC